MRQINIYVEGKGDMIFVCQYLEMLYGLSFKNELPKIRSSCKKDNLIVNIFSFDPVSGNGGINSSTIAALINNIKQADLPVGIESIIIVDADTEEHSDPKGGFIDRNKYLKNLIGDNDIKYFIIPNHTDNGNLENLLDEIISENGKTFYSCLTNYVKCLMSIRENVPKGIRELNSFNKTKLDWYTYIMLGKVNSKLQKQRDYLQVDLWDLQSDTLSNFKAFLNAALKFGN